ncbi:MAG: glycine cleavage system protein H [Deltaproteobacteria bacterium]|nr:glycine cleavage system protein H [Deltaproteobacteria bacterium]
MEKSDQQFLKSGIKERLKARGNYRKLQNFFFLTLYTLRHCEHITGGTHKMGSMIQKIRQPEERSSCIWMQAGVVRLKSCKIDFKCTECRFDKVMQHIADENRLKRQDGSVPFGKKGRIVSWQERLRSLPAAKRPCIHHMKGRIEFRTCTNEYQCVNCDFDQYFYDQYTVHAVVNPVDVLDIKGFKIPQGYYFHRGHTWARIEEGAYVKVGIDDFALRLMGPLDLIEAPLMGKEVKQGRADISVVRGGNIARLLSPISGVVTDINPGLREHGDLANQDPYSAGWVMRIHSDSLRKDLKNLMINRETGDFMEGQIGGYLGHDIYGNMPQLRWEKLTRIFLQT